LATGVIQELFAIADGINEAGSALRASRRGVATPQGVAPPVATPEPPQSAPQVDGTVGSVRVSASKLDALLDLSGELMVARRRIEGRVEDARAVHATVARLQS